MVPPDVSAHPLHGCQILLVEDDQDVREAVEALLLLEGADVIACASAQPAIDLLGGTDAVDLLITDVVLGGALSGFDIAAAAMARRPGMPILLVTGYAGTATRDLPQPVPVLLKPFRHADLMAAIGSLLHSSRAVIGAAA